MARKPPSTDDLKDLLPFVLWRGDRPRAAVLEGRGGAAVLEGGGGEREEREEEERATEMMRTHVTGYSIIKGCMEDLQYQVSKVTAK